MEEFVLYLAQKFPLVLGVLAGVGVLRAVNKPLFMALKSIASATPTQKDDKILEDIERSNLYKFISFVLDWFASVKLPK